MDGLDKVICQLDGKDLTVRELILNQLVMLRVIYVDYFVNEKKPTYKGFLNSCLESVEKMAYAIDDKYADHVEGMRKSIIKKREKNA